MKNLRFLFRRTAAGWVDFRNTKKPITDSCIRSQAYIPILFIDHSLVYFSINTFGSFKILL